MSTDQKIEMFMKEFNLNRMEASDWLFANDDSYQKASEDYMSWDSTK